MQPITNAHVEYLRDESRLSGHAEAIAFPKTFDEVVQALQEANSGSISVTTQGARTGIAAGAVPEGGLILNLSRMKRILGVKADRENGGFSLVVQPGVLLSEVNQELETLEFDTAEWNPESLAALDRLKSAGPHFFPTDPTEASASIGGMVACNASGARSFHYGPTRAHVRGVQVALADGSSVSLRRGQARTQGRSFSMTTDDGRVVRGSLPSYRFPDVKNAAGYFAADTMDLLDLFIGSEGTLGVITAIEIAVSPLPKVIWGVMMFLPSEESALRFVRAVRGEKVEGIDTVIGARPVAVEFFNHDALDLLRRSRVDRAAFSAVREIPPEYHTGVYVEYHGDNEDSVTTAVMAASEIMVKVGGDENATWVADTHKEMENLKFFRHAVPEAVNLLIDERRHAEPELTKLGTDMSVPDARLDEVMAMYNRDLGASGLESLIFGHIGNNHVHVNILPRSMEEYRAGKKLYLQWAQSVVGMGGSVSAEHGIGKLKRDFLALMYGDAGIEEMRGVKRVFDSKGLLNRGNLFAL